MKSTVIAAATLMVMSGTSAAQSVRLHPGETVTVRLENGAPILEGTAPAQPMTKFEIYALWRAETADVPAGAKTVPPGVIREGEGPPSPPHPSDDRLKITMRYVPGITPGSPENTALFIENGYGSAFRYHAQMTAHGRTIPTDVCDVAPHLSGLEHWPYSIDQLDLSDLSLQSFAGSISCQ